MTIALFRSLLNITPGPMDAKELQTIVAEVQPTAAAINPLAGTILFVVEEAIKFEPAIAEELQTLFAKGIPTEEAWTASRARISARFADLAPNAAAQLAAADSTGSAPPNLQPSTAEPSPANVLSIAPTVPAPHPPDVGGNPVL